MSKLKKGERMKKYMSMAGYCRESGFPLKKMKVLVHGEQAEEFTFRAEGKNSTIWIDTEVFETKMRKGDFK